MFKLNEKVTRQKMKTFQLQTQIWLPQSPDKIFDFFSHPRNLDRLTPPWLKFRIETPEAIKIAPGTLLDYRLRIHGVPIRWQSEVSAWQPPHRFVDRQTKGPYSLWVHEHTFEDYQGGTLVGDNVEYAVPGGIIVRKFLVAPDLERIFKYRHQVLSGLFHGSKQHKTINSMA